MDTSDRAGLHSTEAEQSLLGGVMITGGKCLPEVQDVVELADFHRTDHRLVWRALEELDRVQSPCDAITVCDYLALNSQLEAAGGREYIARIVQDTPSAANVRSYAKIVKAFSTRRKLEQASRDIYQLANDPRDVEEVLSAAQEVVMNVGKEQASLGPRPIGQLLPAWMDRLDKMFHVEQEIAGISTGFTDLDRKINGLQRGQLVIIAGRPSMGKSAIAFQILNNITNYKGLPGLGFSLEMSDNEVVTRVVAQIGKVPLDRLLSGNIEDEQWPVIHEAAERLTRSKLILDESPTLQLAQIRARARRATQQYGKLGIIVIDYLQLLQGRDERNGRDNRAQELSEITRGLKALAKELDVPVIALSQLNRDVDKREDRRPRLSDLRESGSIEQDSDVILFVYRDVVYNPDTRHKNIAEIIIGKQRNGPIGTVLLYYFGQYTMFGQMETEAQQSFWTDRYGKQREPDDFDRFGSGDTPF
jgi:replicative DNA helicase